MRKALLVAFQFPPFKASSGLERTLSLVRHLPEFGWEPMVLTARPMAYPAISDERMASIPAATEVRRTLALDAARHFAIRGRYPGWLALPDRWWSWALTAIPAGLALIRRHRPSVIWSTYPITTAHVIGSALSRLSGVPWVADFRDPMVEFVARQQRWYPEHPALRRQRLRTEGDAAQRAAALSFCTEGARDICVQRYAGARHDAWHVVPNGFDESVFASLGTEARSDGSPGDPITLVHSGTIYPTTDRDPTHFLRALAQVLSSRPLGSRPLRVVLRGSGVDALYNGLVDELGLAGCVVFAPLVDYASALREMLAADGLLLFQGYTSNPAIPAKLYEYFRAGRPVLALVDDAGETARCLRSEGVGTLTPLDDAQRIQEALQRFLADIEAAASHGMTRQRAAAFERREAARHFAGVFDGLAR